MNLIKTLTRYTLYTLLPVVLLTSCTDCKHSQTYSKVSKYQILYPYGMGQTFANIYDYKIEGNCVDIKKGKVCFTCGEVIGFESKKICGNYQISEHLYYR